MKALYILNESSFYLRLAWFSVNSLRHYNPDLPVEFILVRDGGRDNRDISNWNEVNLGLPWFTIDQFADEAVSRFKASVSFVSDYDPGEEAGFTPAQRSLFQRVDGDDVLFLDADTFVLDDIQPIFEREEDVVADKNEWFSVIGQPPIDGVKPYNSGVVLYRRGLIRKYGAALHGLMSEIMTDSNPIGQWLSKLEFVWENGNPQIGAKPKKLCKEELAFCIWVLRSGARDDYFDLSDVQTAQQRGRTRIFHTMTQHWYKNWPRFYRGSKFLPPKRIKRSLLM